MAAPKPFKVVPYEIGAADVIDRKTGERVGYVVQWAIGWAAYRLGKRSGVAHNAGRYFKRRGDAATAVWEDQ